MTKFIQLLHDAPFRILEESFYQVMGSSMTQVYLEPFIVPMT